jgi:3D (Asp-Asp-Asp) domain-containing protein
MFTHDFSVSKTPKQDEETNTIAKRLNVSKKAVYKVVATMYNAVEGQCDADPFITACMYKINPQKASEHKWIAVSRDLLKINGGKFVYGQKVRIVGAGKKSGIYTIADTMNKRFKNKIDILETIGTPLYKYNNVKIIEV